VFLWRMPFVTILSRTGMADLRALLACSESPSIIALSTFFTYVRYLDLCPEFRCRRDADWRMRFLACALLAKTNSYMRSLAVIIRCLTRFLKKQSSRRSRSMPIGQNHVNML